MSMRSSPPPPILPCRGAWDVLFGEEIEFIRFQKGLLEEAARRPGLHPAESHALEIGKVPQAWEQILVIAKTLGEIRFNIASLEIR